MKESITFRKIGKALLDEDVKHIESEIGKSLPDVLVEHYLKFNGGKPEKNWFVKGQVNWEVANFITMRHPRFALDVTFENTYNNIVIKKKLMPQHLIPFARDPGGDFFCLDENSGEVVFYAMDHCDNPKKAITTLAPSFSDFVSNLKSEDEVFE